MKNKVNEIQVRYKGGLTSQHWPRIINSSIAAEILFDHWDKDIIELHESFKILLLNNSNRVKGIYELSKGTITGTLVDVRILFAIILKSLSVGIILCHNHPSGKLLPSQADRSITDKIKEGAKFFDIKVLDHIILVPNGNFYSFADEGIL